MRAISIFMFLTSCAFPHGATSQPKEVSCERVDPIRSLTFVSRYAEDDANRATIDPEREADVLDALAPLDGFINSLSHHADRLYEGRTPDRRAAATCIADLLGEWARADALAHLGTETVELTIGSRLASFALIYWQAAPYIKDAGKREEIVAWLERRIEAQIVFWEGAPTGARRGNLRAWAALGAGALSLTSDHPDLVTWAKTSMSDVVCTATHEGSLPQEMTRGEYALHYQLHAVAPLVTSAAILERQGIPAQTICDGALHRVVAFAVGDITGKNRTEAITGEAQTLADDADQLQGYRLAWVEPYLHLSLDPDIYAMVEDMRPLNYTKLGGNQTALWGR